MLVWTDETADQVEQVANLPLSKLMAREGVLGAAEAGGSETSAPVAPLPSGVEAATAALLQGLSEPPPAAVPLAAPMAAAPMPTAAPVAAAPADGLAAAVAAAVAATETETETEAPAATPPAAPVPVGDDLTALIGATGAAQDELATMSGAALSGLRALRGEAAQGATLDELVARAAQAGAQDDYIKALQEEASR